MTATKNTNRGPATPAINAALTGFVALALAMGIGRFAFTPLLPMMRSEALINVGAGGWLAAVHFLGYAMGALFARYLDVAARPAVTLSLVAIGLSTLAMGLTDSLATWMIARWIAGVCSAFVLVLVSSHAVKHLAEARRADLQGLLFGGVGAGIALVGLLVLGLMLAQAASRTGWLICGWLTLGITVLVFARWPRDRAEDARPPSHGPARQARLDWRLILPYGAMGLGYVIPATYLPVMAQAAVPSPLVFGWSWPVFGCAAALSTVLASRLASRFTDRAIWFASQLVLAAGLLLPALWPNLATVIAGGVCVGGTFMVITMAGIREAHRVAGSSEVRHQIAAMTAAFAVGQMAGPAVAGGLYELTGSFAWPLVLASVCLAGTAYLLIGTPALAARSRA